MNTLKSIITQKENDVNESKESIVTRNMRDRQMFKVDDELITMFGHILGPTGIAVYCKLARHAWKDQKVWPKQESIADEIGTSTRSVSAYLKLLAACNIIKIVQLGKMCTNRYWLLDKTKWIIDEKKLIHNFNKISKSDMNILHITQEDIAGHCRKIVQVYRKDTKKGNKEKEVESKKIFAKGEKNSPQVLNAMHNYRHKAFGIKQDKLPTYIQKPDHTVVAVYPR